MDESELKTFDKEFLALIKAAKREAEVQRKKIIEKANAQAKEILTGTKKQLERDRKKLKLSL